VSRPRRTLGRSPPGSVTWAYIGDHGELVVELYEHGAEAEAWFGNDVAFLLRIAAAGKRPLLEALACGPDEWTDAELDERLLDELERRFGSWYEVRSWLDARGVPYRHEFDSWA
jgi:2-polyprenyl-6-methoxyphenol hydroxylase-like FAD-dependent oxidoreductase